MRQYAIEKNIPLPPIKQLARTQYPFEDMAKGDSFRVRVNGEPSKQVLSRVSAAATYAKKKHGHKYTIRRLPGMVRCWRIK